jgi:hypothetical protein
MADLEIDAGRFERSMAEAQGREQPPIGSWQRREVDLGGQHVDGRGRRSGSVRGAHLLGQSLDG